MSSTTRRRAVRIGVGAATATLAAPMVVRGQAKMALRIQTHHSAESGPGKVFLQFCKDVEAMSGGRLQIESFTSSSVVKSVETFDAASTGILDGDMTGAAYQPGKDAAFQAFGDMLGGYDSPDQMQAWLDLGGGREIADPLYAKFGMYLVGFWGDPTESLVSNKPLRGLADLKDWKFRCPPGMQTEIFAKLGAKPVVMDFGEVFTALQTKAVEGADAGTLALNRSLGLYEIAKHTSYPGFHSMPQDHLALNKGKWDGLPAELKAILKAALKKAALDRWALTNLQNAEAARDLAAKGVTLHDWSQEERRNYRAQAQAVWQGWAGKSAFAKQAFESSIAYMKRIGVLG
jgi:TRAP-type C4-dicarboxylate transport system substrate-binding protein